MSRIHFKWFKVDEPRRVVRQLHNRTNSDPVVVGNAVYLPGELRICAVEATRQDDAWLMDVFVETVPADDTAAIPKFEPIAFGFIG